MKAEAMVCDTCGMTKVRGGETAQWYTIELMGEVYRGDDPHQGMQVGGPRRQRTVVRITRHPNARTDVDRLDFCNIECLAGFFTQTAVRVTILPPEVKP